MEIIVCKWNTEQWQQPKLERKEIEHITNRLKSTGFRVSPMLCGWHSFSPSLCCARHLPPSRRSGAQPPLTAAGPVVVISFTGSPPSRRLLNPTQANRQSTEAASSTGPSPPSSLSLSLSLSCTQVGQWGKGFGVSGFGGEDGRSWEKGGARAPVSPLPKNHPLPPFLWFNFFLMFGYNF